jgi:surface polysaccharide O-acyltransferase-like enzyme
MSVIIVKYIQYDLLKFSQTSGRIKLIALYLYCIVFISNSIRSLYRYENKSQTTGYRKCHNYSI